MVQEETESWTCPGKQNSRVDQIYILGHRREIHFMGIWLLPNRARDLPALIGDPLWSSPGKRWVWLVKTVKLSHPGKQKTKVGPESGLVSWICSDGWGSPPGQWCRAERTEGGDPGEERPGNNQKYPLCQWRWPENKTNRRIKEEDEAEKWRRKDQGRAGLPPKAISWDKGKWG